MTDHELQLEAVTLRRARPGQTEGLGEISRGLRSGTTTPPDCIENNLHPEWVTEPQSLRQAISAFFHPFRVDDIFDFLPGVSLDDSLNPRLFSSTASLWPEARYGELVFQSGSFRFRDNQRTRRKK